MRSDAISSDILGWVRGHVQTHAKRLYRGLIVALAVAAILGMMGGTWDAAWHVTLRREGFWSPPHILLYAGTSLTLIIGTVAIGSALLLGWRTPGPWITLSRPIPLGFAVAALGSAIVLAAAPVDDLWHRTFGPDVDVWSFPHLVAIAGGFIINLGAVMAVGAELRALGGRARGHRLVMLLFLSILCWLMMFSLNWYTLVLARWRDSFQYPIVASFVTPIVLVVAARAFGRGGATLAALGYTIYTAAAHYMLHGLGYALLPFPPLIVVPAIMIDFVVTRPFGHGWQRALLAGLLFGPTFFAAEAASLAWFPHPFITEPPTTGLALAYMAAAMDRPWELGAILRTLPLTIAIGAGSSLAGWWIGALTRRVQQDPGPFPEPRLAARDPEGAPSRQLLPR
jgi:hypothetical protein